MHVKTARNIKPKRACMKCVHARSFRMNSSDHFQGCGFEPDIELGAVYNIIWGTSSDIYPNFSVKNKDGNCKDWEAKPPLPPRKTFMERFRISYFGRD